MNSLPTLVLKNATLIDGRSPQSIPYASVLIEDNKIIAINREPGPGALDSSRGTNPEPANRYSEPQTDPAYSPGRQLIDAQGGTILPGFIDTHVHMTLEGVNIARDIMAPFSLRFYQSVGYMRRTLEAGITSVRDAGGADLGLKQAVESGLIAGPRLQISINALTITGGHGDGWMPSGAEFSIFQPHPGLPDGRDHSCQALARPRQRPVASDRSVVDEDCRDRRLDSGAE